MFKLLLAYLGGVLTIVSPCILPVLPFVFARADRPFRRSGLPLLVGMAVSFAAVATLAAVGAGWAVAANHAGRVLALALLALFGLTLLFPALSDRLTRPLVALGSRLSARADAGGGSVGGSLLLGVATGLLWAPCAGPILGLILTGAALQGASVATTLMLFAYAAGAATSLALALLVGGRVFAAMKRGLHVGEWIRRALGAAVLVGVAAIALGMDTGVLTRLSLASTNGLEQRLYDRLAPRRAPAPAPTADATNAALLPIEGVLPPLTGATAWINSPPLTPAELRGKVVLIDFWTYSCINCLRTLPYIRAWAAAYRDQGLVVIGVHSPEFAFEKDLDNVRAAVTRLHIAYPVAVDSDYAIWKAFSNEYWPADYIVDAQGNIRAHAFGEGDYLRTEQTIRALLAAAGHPQTGPMVTPGAAGTGDQAAADIADVQSPETYLGTARAERFASPGGAVAGSHAYTDAALALNQWSLAGQWSVGPQAAVLDAPGGSISFRFHARDLHLVLGPGATPVHFTVTLDGKPPGDSHGADTDAAGNGIVTTQRLYQLIRQGGPVADHTMTIHFTDPGVQAYAFTFG